MQTEPRGYTSPVLTSAPVWGDLRGSLGTLGRLSPQQEFPKLEVSDISKPIELASAALWYLGLDKGTDSLSSCIHGHGRVGVRLLQVLLIVLLAKCMFLRNLKSAPLRD